MCITLNIKQFSFNLKKDLITSKHNIKNKHGWLIYIENPNGNRGWGEISDFGHINLANQNEILSSLKNRKLIREEIEYGIKIWPRNIAFGLGSALAEMDGLNSKNDWLKAPKSAILLPEGEQAINKFEDLIEINTTTREQLTIKLKVGINPSKERNIILKILDLASGNIKIRLDANGGWTRKEANYWAQVFLNDNRLEWLEEPLSAEDIEGLYQLAKLVPVALDESLIKKPSLIKTWPGWQVRKPLIDGDPRIILKELELGLGHRALSTAFETGIGRRWVNHLSALQQRTTTPTAPGLAPGWCPEGPLFSENPVEVWEAA